MHPCPDQPLWPLNLKQPLYWTKNKLHVERGALQASERDGRYATRAAAKRAPDTAKTNVPLPPKTVARANERAPDAAENIWQHHVDAAAPWRGGGEAR